MGHMELEKDVKGVKTCKLLTNKSVIAKTTVI